MYKIIFISRCTKLFLLVGVQTQVPRIIRYNGLKAQRALCPGLSAFALFVPTSSAALGIAFKASLMLCSHLHEQSGRALIRDPLTAVGMLVLFATVEKIPEAIKAGRSIKVQKGNFCAEIEASD